MNMEMNPLLKAAKMGDIKELELLVKVEDVNLKDKDNYTALAYASANGHLEAVKFLVENGVDVNDKLAIKVASENGQNEVLAYLMSKQDFQNEI
ncbi:ankyrin repeat domain-containing protein [Brachyspira hampsonii]|nr:ankyrin repeat domain-containing protein [Brachyspira hampsonii]